MIKTFNVYGHKWHAAEPQGWVEAHYTSKTAAAAHRDALILEDRPGVVWQIFNDVVYETHEEYVQENNNSNRSLPTKIT